ncbi:ribosome recycling factor [Candidatus Gracilibacteria bacterium]|nr:ribosome recycling factor [Candidatus Gracilibacteria bacterium]MCF7898827.1 ribosome recycling factor [Candidatus Paceibacterota bacterium]
MSYDFSKVKTQKEAILEWLKSEYRSISTGRATPQVLDLVHIDLYGAKTQIAHAGSVTIEDPRTLRVSPWDKTIVGVMEKAVNDADLGLSVSSDADGLRVHFPALTTETRQKLVKLLKERLEEARVRVRSFREETNRDIDDRAKEGEYGEDDQHKYREELQKNVDGANTQLEELFHKKEREVMGEDN